MSATLIAVRPDRSRQSCLPTVIETVQETSDSIFTDGIAAGTPGRRSRSVVLVADCTRLIAVGRRSGAIPPGPPPRVLAGAYLGAVEGLVISISGHAPHDVTLAERVALGLLGLAPAQEAAGL